MIRVPINEVLDEDFDDLPDLPATYFASSAVAHCADTREFPRVFHGDQSRPRRPVTLAYPGRF